VEQAREKKLKAWGAEEAGKRKGREKRPQKSQTRQSLTEEKQAQLISKKGNSRKYSEEWGTAENRGVAREFLQPLAKKTRESKKTTKSIAKTRQPRP